ncbi:MAG: hypothetical protein KAS71_04220, partial [Bacteroidales bacterium]|nr:hypothetical protein [Bacteroidales bacterium]
MKILFAISLIFGISFIINAQNYDQSFTITDNEDLTVWEIEADLNGNVTIIGDFYDSLDIDPGVNVNMIYTDKQFDPGSFVASYTSSGQLRWGLSSDSLILQAPYIKPQSIKVYEDGTTFVLCRINGTVDLDPGIGTQLVSDTGQVYALKIDKNGNYNSHFRLTEDAVETASFAMDNDKNIYLLGSFSFTAEGFDANGGEANTTFTSIGLNDNFLAKYDSIGNIYPSFAFNFGTIKDEYGGNIWVDNLGHLIIYGIYNPVWTRDLNMNPDLANPVILNQFQSRFFAQYNTSDLSLNWAYSLGSINSGNIIDLTTSTTGDIYITGFFDKEIAFDLISQTTGILYPNFNTKTIFTAKYDNSANLQFVKKIGHGASSNIQANSIHLGTDDQVMILGSLNTSISFNTHTSYDDSYSPVANSDIYLAKYNSLNGELVYVDVLECSNSANFGESYMLDSTFYIAGNFLETLDLDPDSTVNEQIISNAIDKRDLFIAKYYTFFRDTTSIIDPIGNLIENGFGSSLHYYPNPTHDWITISLGGAPTDIVVKVIDLTGKTILSEEKKSVNQFELNFEGKRGYYL